MGSQHRGPGLGLSLVRSFVELHGGTVTINSDAGAGHHRHLRVPDRAGSQADRRLIIHAISKRQACLALPPHHPSATHPD